MCIYIYMFYFNSTPPTSHPVTGASSLCLVVARAVATMAAASSTPNLPTRIIPTKVP